MQLRDKRERFTPLSKGGAQTRAGHDPSEVGHQDPGYGQCLKGDRSGWVSLLIVHLRAGSGPSPPSHLPGVPPELFPGPGEHTAISIRAEGWPILGETLPGAS